METGFTKSLCSLLFALTCTLGLGACNTMEGAGQDIERAGDAIEDEAREHK